MGRVRRLILQLPSVSTLPHHRARHGPNVSRICSATTAENLNATIKKLWDGFGQCLRSWPGIVAAQVLSLLGPVRLNDHRDMRRPTGRCDDLPCEGQVVRQIKQHPAVRPHHIRTPVHSRLHDFVNGSPGNLTCPIRPMGPIRTILPRTLTSEYCSGKDRPVRNFFRYLYSHSQFLRIGHVLDNDRIRSRVIHCLCLLPAFFPQRITVTAKFLRHVRDDVPDVPQHPCAVTAGLPRKPRGGFDPANALASCGADYVPGNGSRPYLNRSPVPPGKVISRIPSRSFTVSVSLVVRLRR